MQVEQIASEIIGVWTSESVDNNQLWIEAEAIVVGKFGIQPVYKTLQSIRDRTIATERAASRITDATLTGDLEMARDRLRELEQQLAWKEGLIRQLTEVDMPALEGQLATLQAATPVGGGEGSVPSEVLQITVRWGELLHGLVMDLRAHDIGTASVLRKEIDTMLAWVEKQKGSRDE